MKELKLTLTLDEANIVMSALGAMPYAQVADLVHKLRIQAAQQLDAPKASEPEPENGKE